jgi:hypothetical protein
MSIDDDSVINLDKLRKAMPHFMACAALVEPAHVIELTWDNGDIDHLRYESRELRDKDLGRLFGESQGYPIHI